MVIGTLREEGLIDDTIILFTADHGDMLGDHGLWAKRLYYEQSANVPMLLVGRSGDDRVGHNRADGRLVGWQDVMPTLLDLAGVDVPDTVEGISMVGEEKRDRLYGECGENADATRMMHDGRYKLIYYPVGNRIQLFDLEEDPRECRDLSASPGHGSIMDRLTGRLAVEMKDRDGAWVRDGELTGLPDREYTAAAQPGACPASGACTGHLRPWTLARPTYPDRILENRSCAAARILIASILLSGWSLPALAWGPNGHRIVGEIAENHLTDAARKGIAELVGRASLAQISTWADEIKSDPAWRHASPWHYINVPPGPDPR